MAIVKMKKLRAAAVRSQRDALLRELMLLGCVELSEQDALLSDETAAALVTPDQGDVAEAYAERQLFREALAVLDQYAPKKTPFLSPKPEISVDALLDDGETAATEGAARRLTGCRDKLKALAADEGRERLRLEALAPWKACPLPLDCPGTRYAAVTFGALPAQTGLDALCADLAERTPAAELFPVSEDEAARYVYVIHLRSETEAVLQVLRDHGFTVPAFGDASGSAASLAAEAEARLAALAAEREETVQTILDAAPERDALRRCCDRAETRAERAEAAGKLLKTRDVLFLEGWTPADREADVTALLQKFGCAYEFTEPAEAEYDDVPVQLRNNKLTDGLNMVTNMYSLPRYGSVDPNPLMAPFFILFYGIMMADMGYGLVMLIVGLLITLKKKPRSGFLRYFGELMIEGGIVTFIMGIFTGGLFGDAPKWIVSLVSPASSWAGLPARIDPLNDTVTVLIGALILGFIHLIAGMIISFSMKVRDGRLMDGLAEEGSMWVLFICLALTVLGVGKAGGVPVPLIIGLLAFAWGKSYGKKGIGKVTGIFSGIYSEATGWFGDILSYARLMALMLAGSVVASVFNQLGAMPGNIIIFLIISLLGNTLNFGLNLLGCYVHDLRLQCLEFFNKFYVAGGKPFTPLKLRPKYYDVAE